jgi:hypothetical protein
LAIFTSNRHEEQKVMLVIELLNITEGLNFLDFMKKYEKKSNGMSYFTKNNKKKPNCEITFQRKENNFQAQPRFF